MLSDRQRTAAAALGLGIAVLMLLALGPVGAAGQQYNNTSTAAPYYNNESTTGVGDAFWLDLDPGAPTETMIELGQRLPTFIGLGSPDPSGAGFQGTLLTGLLMAGTALGATFRSGVGIVGGSVLSVVVGYVLTDFGFAPLWLRPVLVLPLAVLASIALLRVVNR